MSYACCGVSNHLHPERWWLMKVTSNKTAPCYWPFVLGIHQWPVDSQMACDAESVSIVWRHYGRSDKKEAPQNIPI